VIIPSLLKGFDLMDSELWVLRAVEIEVCVITGTFPHPLVPRQHLNPVLMVIQIHGYAVFMRTMAWRGCQRYAASMGKVLVIDHVLLRERPECVNELRLSPGLANRGNQGFGGCALQVRERRGPYLIDMSADVDDVRGRQFGNKRLRNLASERRQPFRRTLRLRQFFNIHFRSSRIFRIFYLCYVQEPPSAGCDRNMATELSCLAQSVDE
jgi:hypothetical protein